MTGWQVWQNEVCLLSEDGDLAYYQMIQQLLLGLQQQHRFSSIWSPCSGFKAFECLGVSSPVSGAGR